MAVSRGLRGSFPFKTRPYFREGLGKGVSPLIEFCLMLLSVCH